MKRQVNNLTKRDEFYHRLSSFLYHKGMLEINKITGMNPHVFYIETKDEKKLILKKHHNHKNVKQQWDFLEEIDQMNVVPFKRYPNGRKIIDTKKGYWTISPYISGDKLYYKYATDRTEAVRTIHKFHSQATNIQITNPISKEHIFVRWYKRLLTFKKTEEVFRENGFMALYKDIVQITMKQLRSITQYPWEKYEQYALEKGTWTHGDVASHNFIRNNNTYLIDFDLLQCTAQIYDFIQLGHRFLPYIDWDLEKLLTYRMVQNSEVRVWLSALFIPTDLLREWLYFIHSDRSSSHYNYLKDMEKEWTKRHVFLKNAQSMLKSI